MNLSKQDIAKRHKHQPNHSQHNRTRQRSPTAPIEYVPVSAQAASAMEHARKTGALRQETPQAWHEDCETKDRRTGQTFQWVPEKRKKTTAPMMSNPFFPTSKIRRRPRRHVKVQNAFIQTVQLQYKPTSRKSSQSGKLHQKQKKKHTGGLFGLVTSSVTHKQTSYKPHTIQRD